VPESSAVRSRENLSTNAYSTNLKKKKKEKKKEQFKLYKNANLKKKHQERYKVCTLVAA
jgi:hypothetical protein